MEKKSKLQKWKIKNRGDVKNRKNMVHFIKFYTKIVEKNMYFS